MTVHTITRAAFNEWALANRDNPESDASEDSSLIQWEDVDDENDPRDPFDQMTEYLVGIAAVNAEHGITATDDSVTFTIPGLDAARLVYDLVMDDYNGSNGRSTDLPDSPWTIHELAGDEAVDECGSHPIIAIDLLLECMKTRGIE